MSKPEQHAGSEFLGIANEIVSAMSALNMEPSPKQPHELTEDDRFLSETDNRAEHAMEHLKKAIELHRVVSRQIMV